MSEITMLLMVPDQHQSQRLNITFKKTPALNFLVLELMNVSQVSQLSRLIKRWCTCICLTDIADTPHHTEDAIS